MPTDTATDATPAPESASPEYGDAFAPARAERLPFPPRARRLRLSLPRDARKALRSLDRSLTRLVETIADKPDRRLRASVGGALLMNFALLAVLAVYGRVYIFVPNKPADSISVVYVDLPASPPVVDLRDPEIAPEPEPEPVIEPQLTPEPEPAPAPEPEEAAAPEPEPEPVDEPEPEPVIDLTPAPVFAPPSEIEDAPLIPDADAPSAMATVEEPLPGDIAVEGEQAPSDEAPPLITVEPEARRAEIDEDAGEEEEQGDEAGAGEIAAGEQEAVERSPSVAAAPAPDTNSLAGDDLFDEEPVFNGRRLALPQVDLPKGDATAVPGTSGVVAIFCPEEFKDKEKIAECAGRPEIRSGWRPGSSGEDFSKAAAVLKTQRKHGDFSNDAVTFGPEIARQIEQRKRQEDLEDFRRNQDGLGTAGVADDPAAGLRPDIGPGSVDPSWTKRDDPLVDNKDVERLKKELEDAERRKSVPEQ